MPYEIVQNISICRDDNNHHDAVEYRMCAADLEDPRIYLLCIGVFNIDNENGHCEGNEQRYHGDYHLKMTVIISLDVYSYLNS